MKLPRLKTLNLSENKLKFLEEFEGHPCIEEMNLSKNRLRRLTGIHNCPKLKILNVSDNKIREFGNESGTMGDLPALETFDMSA